MKSADIKKLNIIYLLKVLQEHSDEDHPLKQQEIADLIKSEYGSACDRKTIARHIEDLADADYEIGHISRKGYYYGSRAFEDSELRLLIDSVLASRYIPKNMAKDLTEKLIGQSSKYFKKQMRHVHNIDRMEYGEGKQLFFTIEELSKAIDHKKQVAFFYNKYDADKELHHTTNEKQIVNPYQIVIANGRYYLIGNVDKYDNVTHYRVEKITDIEILDTNVKPQNKVAELRNGLDLPSHMAEHVYMFSGKSSYVTMKVAKWGMNDVIDWFGRDIEVKENDDHCIVRVKVNEQAISYWAIQFGGLVEVLEPAHIRADIAEKVTKIYDKYKG